VYNYTELFGMSVTQGMRDVFAHCTRRGALASIVYALVAYVSN